MIYLAFLFFGGLIGTMSWYYCANFFSGLKQMIYQNAAELFAQIPLISPENTDFDAQNRSVFRKNFLVVWLTFPLLALVLPSDFALWAGLSFALISTISTLDWQYQLISPTPCLLLFFSGLFGADWQFSALNLHESLQSAVIFFATFYSIYYAAKMIYHKEAFGRGDYWLALGLGAFLPLSNLPHFLLLSSLFGIAFALVTRRTNVALPFAPFMSLAAIVIFAVNMIN